MMDSGKTPVKSHITFSYLPSPIEDPILMQGNDKKGVGQKCIHVGDQSPKFQMLSKNMRILKLPPGVSASHENLLGLSSSSHVSKYTIRPSIPSMGLMNVASCQINSDRNTNVVNIDSHIGEKMPLFETVNNLNMLPRVEIIKDSAESIPKITFIPLNTNPSKALLSNPKSKIEVKQSAGDVPLSILSRRQPVVSAQTTQNESLLTEALSSKFDLQSEDDVEVYSTTAVVVSQKILGHLSPSDLEKLQQRLRDECEVSLLKREHQYIVTGTWDGVSKGRSVMKKVLDCSVSEPSVTLLDNVGSETYQKAHDKSRCGSDPASSKLNEVINTVIQIPPEEENHTPKLSIQDLQCEVCLKVFSCKAGLEKHYARSGKGRKHVCLTCQSPFHGMKDVITHSKQSHPEVWKGTGKTRQHGSKGATAEPLLSAKPEPYEIPSDDCEVYLCKKCSQQYKTWPEWLEHIVDNHDTFEISCKFCTVNFKSVAKLLSHIKELHFDSRGMLICNSKENMLDGEGKYCRHNYTEKEEKTNRKLMTHIEKVPHGQKPEPSNDRKSRTVTCKVGGEKLSSTEISRHTCIPSVQAGNRTHVCCVCEQLFCSHEELAKHALAHLKPTGKQSINQPLASQGTSQVITTAQEGERVADMIDNSDYSDLEDKKLLHKEMTKKVARSVQWKAPKRDNLDHLIDYIKGGISNDQRSNKVKLNNVDTQVNGDNVMGTSRSSDFNIQDRYRNVHVCKICCIKTTKVGLVRHMKRHHQEKKHVCQRCKKAFVLNSDLEVHIKRHYDSDGNFRKIRARKDVIGMAKATWDAELLYRCKICWKEFADIEIVRKHLKTHLDLQGQVVYIQSKIPISSKLSSCGKVPEESNEKNGWQYQCEKCHRKFIRQQDLSRHTRTCNMSVVQTGEDTMFGCDQCDFQSPRKVSTKKHIDQVHREKKYICDTCGLTFLHLQDLKDHIKEEHSGQKEVCPVCGKEFKKAKYLAVHQLRHEGKLRHFCQICQRGFYEKHRLKLHMQIHLTDRIPEGRCNICDKTFLSKKYYLQHMNAHRGLKPYKCTICTKAFSTAASLHKHKFVHSEEKPFHCPEANCGKAFKFKNKLQLHMIVHTKESKHNCGDCGAVFTQHFSLVKHKNKCKKKPGNSAKTSKANSEHEISSVECVPSSGWQVFTSSSQDILHLGETVQADSMELTAETGVDTLQRHSGVKELFMCSVCNKLFYNWNDVELHMLEHTSGTNNEPPGYDITLGDQDIELIKTDVGSFDIQDLSHGRSQVEHSVSELHTATGTAHSKTSTDLSATVIYNATTPLSCCDVVTTETVVDMETANTLADLSSILSSS